MPAYIWATVAIGEPAPFGAYARAAADAAADFGGEYLIRGSIAEVFEGTCEPAQRAILIRFPDADRARAFIHSEAYAAAKALRAAAGGAVNSRLVVVPD